MHQFSYSDILSVSIIGVIAVTWIVRQMIKKRNVKSNNGCSGCHNTQKCGSRSYK